MRGVCMDVFCCVCVFVCVLSIYMVEFILWILRVFNYKWKWTKVRTTKNDIKTALWLSTMLLLMLLSERMNKKTNQKPIGRKISILPYYYAVKMHKHAQIHMNTRTHHASSSFVSLLFLFLAFAHLDINTTHTSIQNTLDGFLYFSMEFMKCVLYMQRIWISSTEYRVTISKQNNTQHHA